MERNEEIDLDKAMEGLYIVATTWGVHNIVLESILDDVEINPEVLLALQEFIAAYDTWLD